MSTIQPKKAPVIKKGTGYTYNPETFAIEHAMPHFIETDDPNVILENIKPFIVDGRKFITFDTETHPYFSNSHVVPKTVIRRWVGTGKKAVPQDYPFCISICDGKKAYTIYDSVDNGFAKFRALAPLFEDPTIEKIAHNTKYDMHMFANAGLKIVGRLHDTVVLAKLANENRMSFKLRDLAAKKSGGVIKFEYMVDAYKQMNKIGNYTHIPRQLLTQYANADVWNCFIVFVDEYEKLVFDELVELYDRECELMVALYAMERYGMTLDRAYEAPLKEELQELTDSAEAAIYAEAGKLFNINSGKQLYQVLLDLGVNRDWIALSDKGNPVLDKKALGTLAEVHEVSIIQKILDFRKYSKLLTTYAYGMYEQHDAEERIHGSINQTEAITGRMSITKPALQTLPKKDKRIRKAFIPDDGYRLWFMDLDQVEYRLFAHYAQCGSLLEAIINGHDVHAATAATIYNKELDAVSEDERQRAKTINFSLIYGQGNEASARALKVTVSEAIQIKGHYFAQIPEARPFIQTVHQVIKMRGFVKNFYGRRRRLSTNDAYKAPNALIQGCAADYIKKKVVEIYKYLQYNELQTRLINIVHDELVISLKHEEESHAPIIRWLLSDFETFRCPITAGVDTGEPSWGEKEGRPEVGFEEPTDKGYLSYDVYNGSVFNIYKGEQ